MRRPDPTQIFALAAEFMVVVPTLVLFAVIYADDLRTTLWEIGGNKGWNSDPRLRIYFYANHREPPEIPFIWSQRLTDSVLAIAMLGVAVWLARFTLLYFGATMARINAVYDILLSGLWTYAVVAQSSGDFSDPEHPCSRPWYLEKSCTQVGSQNRGACVAAKVSFFLALLAMTMYFVRAIFSVLALAYWCGENEVFDRSVDWLCGGSWGRHPLGDPYFRIPDKEDEWDAI